MVATTGSKLDQMWSPGLVFDSTGANQAGPIKCNIEGANVQSAGRSTANSHLQAPDTSKLAASIIIDFVDVYSTHPDYSERAD